MPNRTRYVSWSNGQDFDCVLLGSLGFSSRLIERKTGLTMGQIGYRLKKASVRRLDFRNGVSPEAAVVLRQHRTIAEPVLRRRLPETPARGHTTG